MTSYLLTFTVYTTAMIGAIFIALFVYKKFSVTQNRISTSKFLEVEDCINLGVRKQLYVVRAGTEKFLIASDTERTTFLSKLNANEEVVPIRQKERVKDIEFDLASLYSVTDNSVGKKDATAILRNIVSTGERKNG